MDSYEWICICSWINTLMSPASHLRSSRFIINKIVSYNKSNKNCSHTIKCCLLYTSCVYNGIQYQIQFILSRFPVNILEIGTFTNLYFMIQYCFIQAAFFSNLETEPLKED